MKVNLEAGKNEKQNTEKKPIVFGRNMGQFSSEQIEHVATELKDFFEFFGYCSKLSNGECAYTHTPEWI